jgi:hypothetical protein
LALAQAVLESAVLLVWRVKVRKRMNQTATFSKAIEALQGKSLIDGECRSAIERRWADQDVFLFRKESDPELKIGAQNTLSLLEEIASQFFGHSERDGVVIPDHPEYWAAFDAETPILAGTQIPNREGDDDPTDHSVA